MLKLRVLTVALLLPAFAAAAVWLPGLWWSVVIFAAIMLAAVEWTRLARFGPAIAIAFYCLVALGCALAWSERGLDNWIFGASVVFWSVATPLALWRKVAFRGNLLLMAAGIVVLVPLWLALVRLQAQPALMLALLAIVWISDTAAYGAGHAWGRHKLAATISPGKTWEGVGGAIVAVAVYALFFHFWWFRTTDLGLVVTSFFAITVLGILGDLLESLLKRNAGVKDSGNLLPGHGGILDRIDALTAAMPLAAMLFARS